MTTKTKRKKGEQLFNDRYRMLKPLGCGGQGVVYLVEDLNERFIHVSLFIFHKVFICNPEIHF